MVQWCIKNFEKCSISVACRSEAFFLREKIKEKCRDNHNVKNFDFCDRSKEEKHSQKNDKGKKKGEKSKRDEKRHDKIKGESPKKKRSSKTSSEKSSK